MKIIMVLLLLLIVVVMLVTDGHGAEKDSSYFFASAIQTVAGEQPEAEWVAITFRTVGPRYFQALFTLDVAISNVSDSADVEVNEASILLSYLFYTKGSQRAGMVGPTARIIGNVPYVGFYVGGMELTNSLFATSFITGGFLWRAEEIRFTNSFMGGVVQSYQNFYIAGGVHSPEIKSGFINSFRIVFDLLFPFKDGKVLDMISRVSIEIPVGGIVKW